MLSYEFREFDASNLYIKNKKGAYEYNKEETENVIKNLKIMTGEICAICCRKYDEDKKRITIEHIKCRTHNDELSNVSSNLIACCNECNNQRGREKQVFNLYTLKNIHDDYIIGIDGKIIVDDSSKHKQLIDDSIKAYGLNSAKLKNMRKVCLNKYHDKVIIEYYYNEIENSNLDVVEFPFILAQKFAKDNDKRDFIINKYSKRWD